LQSESMKVLVTGGSGMLGRATIRVLAERDHELVSADRRPLGGAENLAWHRQTDLTDVGQVAGAMAGCDAVVHLGAIPAPYHHPDERVFSNNVLSTFAVLQAAALLSVRKAVVASSVSALGPAWAPTPLFPLYAPVDEEHPLLPQDPYGLSKEVDERTCAMFYRRRGMSVLALRLHRVTLPGEAQELAGQVRERPEAWARNLWGYVDVRDAANACLLGLEAEGLGFEVFNVTAADTLSEVPTEELIRRHCPGVEIRRPLQGTESAWSIRKAGRLLGYRPRHSWRDPNGAIPENP
jgi:nucleoside-diphosphate-sugar epimerase